MIHNLTFIYYLSSRGLDGIDINNNIEVDNHQTGPEDEGANVATIVLAVLLALVLLVGLAVLLFVKRGLAFVSIHLFLLLFVDLVLVIPIIWIYILATYLARVLMDHLQRRRQPQDLNKDKKISSSEVRRIVQAKLNNHNAWKYQLSS